MPQTNAERQARWRAKRNKLASQASRLTNAPLDLIVADHLKRGIVTAKERRLAVQRLLKSIDPEYDDALIVWLRVWMAQKHP